MVIHPEIIFARAGEEVDSATRFAKGNPTARDLAAMISRAILDGLACAGAQKGFADLRIRVLQAGTVWRPSLSAELAPVQGSDTAGRL